MIADDVTKGRVFGGTSLFKKMVEAFMQIDVTSYKPFHTRTSHDTSTSNSLYWVTILNSSLAYSLTTMRDTYGSYVKKFVSDGYLDYATYTSFVNGVNGATKGEYSAVNVI